MIRRLLFVCLSVTSLLPDQLGRGGASTQPIAPTFFGLHTGSSHGEWPPLQFGALGKAAGVTWGYIEPAHNQYQWSGLDSYASEAEHHRVDFFYAFANTPQWASRRPAEHCYHGNVGCAAPPSHIEYWNEFVTALVTRFKGRIKFYEIWDEPNTEPEWSGSVEELVELARNAFSIIKSIDPNAVVLTPAVAAGDVGYQPTSSRISGIAQVWMEKYLRAGGDKYADGGNWHGYLMPTASMPYRMPEDSVSPCRITSWNYDRSCSGSILDEVKAMRRVFDENGMANKPIFNTEGSWGKNVVHDPEVEAAWLARYFLLQAGRGVERVYWYGWGVEPWGVLRTPLGTANLAGMAYRQVYRWLVGATVTSACAVLPEAATWSCSISRPGGYEALIIWNTDGQRIYAAVPTYHSFRDLLGNAYELARPATIGPMPIILETTILQSAQEIHNDLTFVAGQREN